MFDKEPNIDIVFRNGLKNLEVLPPGDVWESIPTVPVRRPYSYFAAVAAGLALLFGISYVTSWIAKNNNTEARTQLAAFIRESSAVLAPDLLGSASMASVSPSEIFMDENQGIRNRIVEMPITSFAGPSLVSLVKVEPGMAVREEKKEALDETGDIQVSFPLLPAHVYMPAAQLALMSKPETNAHRFSLGASLSPAYGAATAGDDAQLNDLLSNEEVLTSYSTGLSIAYRISSRLTFESGLALSSIGQKVKGVDVFSGLSDHFAAKGEYLYAVHTASGTVLSTNNDIYLSDPLNRVGPSPVSGLADVSKYKLDRISGEINQVFRYLEVPMVLRYKVIDRQVDFNLSGGMSYGFLIQNMAYVTEGNDKVPIGQTQGVTMHTLSSQVGVGMEYKISKQLSFNVEPVLRYYLTPFSDAYTSISRPYSIGVYSGIFFRF